MPLTALKVGRVMPEGEDDDGDWTDWSPYTYPFNLTQQPAASVPCGLASNGLPIGAQIVGRLGEDGMVLQAARRSSMRCRWRPRQRYKYVGILMSYIGIFILLK